VSDVASQWRDQEGDMLPDEAREFLAEEVEDGFGVESTEE
jgi:hypothetical protein